VASEASARSGAQGDAERRRAIEWEPPAGTDPDASQLSGLEFLQAIVSGRLPRAPISALMGFDIEEVEKGRAVFRGTSGEHLCNPAGAVHGGFAMTLIDSAAGCAVHSTLPIGTVYATLETKVNLVRPILIDTGRLACEGTLIHRGSRIATAEARIVGEDGRLYAHGTSTCSILELKR
jgi:uncharacterized protein (TIGR00369 family)